MSDSGSTQSPGGSRFPGQITPGFSDPPLKAQIIGVPNELRSVQVPLLLNGTVTETRPNNVAKILTPQGEIVVQTPPRAPPLREGQTLDVEIRAGEPPQTARLSVQRPATEKPPETAPSSTQGQTKPAPQTNPAARPVQTPVDVEIRPRQSPAPDAPTSAPVRTPQPLSSARPPPDYPVRLEPVTPGQVLEYLKTALAGRIETYTALDDFWPQTSQVGAPVPQKSLPQIPNPAAPLITSTKIPQNAVSVAPLLLSGFSNFQTEQPPQPAFFNPEIPEFLQTPLKLLFPASAYTGVSPPAGQYPAISVRLDPTALRQPGTGLSVDIAGQNALTGDPGARITSATAGFTPAPFLNKEQGSFTALIQNLSLPQPFFPSTLSESSKLSQAALILQPQKAGEQLATVITATPQNLPVITLAPAPSAVLPALRGDNAAQIFQALTQSDADFFVLHAPARPALVPGTTISFLPGPGGPVQPSMQAALVPPPLAFLTPEPWPLMTEIQHTLAQIAPALAQAMSAMTPSPAAQAQLGPAMLFFIAAVRGGDLSQWLGERAVETLRQSGRGSLLSRLTGESGALSRLAAEPVSGDWRGMSIPMAWDNQIHKVALHYRREQEETEKEGKHGGQTRFVFDLSMDRIGPVQIDGLFRPGRLDLALRTQNAFSSPMQTEMKEIYIHALGQSQLTGDLIFQNHPDQWVTIQGKTREFGASA